MHVPSYYHQLCPQPLIFLFIFVPNAFNIRRYHPFHSLHLLLAKQQLKDSVYFTYAGSLFPPKTKLQFTASMSNKNKKTKKLLPFRASWSFVFALFMEGRFNENLRGRAWKSARISIFIQLSITAN